MITDEYGNATYCPGCKSENINKEGAIYFFYTCRDCGMSYDPTRVSPKKD